MSLIPVDASLLARLQPVSALSPARLNELAGLCFVEATAAGQNPFRLRGPEGQSIYLIEGELELVFGNRTDLIRAKGAQEPYPTPLGRPGAMPAQVRAKSAVQILRVDDDLLDILLTWDQLSGLHRNDPPTPAHGPGWMLSSGMFQVKNLKYGAIARLPASRLDELFSRLERVPVRRGQVVILEGDVGDYYYLIDQGTARVTRKVGGVSMELAVIGEGDAFGEEALVSDAQRNATVTMTSDGALLRLSKPDFVELLKEPLLARMDGHSAMQHVTQGAMWLDVRYPSEFQGDRLPGAINIPLGEIRNAAAVLDRDREYICYCQSGRRSSVAAFILAQRGYKVGMLAGGLWEQPEVASLRQVQP